MSTYDLIVIGAGPSGMMAAIHAARRNKRVLILEKLPQIATKLKATGGGRCNLTNTLEIEDFIFHFGKEGRFIAPALYALNSSALQDFFQEIGVSTHAPDGFRIFPVGHNSTSIIKALHQEIKRLEIKLLLSTKITSLKIIDRKLLGVTNEEKKFFHSHNVLIATGGMGYPQLGAQGDGYRLAQTVGHTIKEPHPAMMPLQTKENWVANCRANTIPKAILRVALKKYQTLQAQGDLIFTKHGIRGPVVLDFSREITPLLAKFNEVPIEVNLTKGMNEDQVHQHIKKEQQRQLHPNTLSLISSLIPESLTLELCKIAQASPHAAWSKLSGSTRNKIIKLLVKMPLTINGHDGFKMAMITRGGILLKEVDPNTLESKKLKGLYFAGEVLDLDGPCGGYNLQWAFSSGYLVGMSC